MSFVNKDFNNIAPFRFWCQKVLPLVYDDSLSYYELLCKVVNHINLLAENNNSLTEGYKQLVDYVNNYFETLDVDKEINEKLDEMAKDGTLSKLIAPLVINAVTVEFVNGVSQMKDITKLYVNLENGNLYFYNGSEWENTGITYGNLPYYNQAFMMFAGAIHPTYNPTTNILTIPQNVRLVSSHYEYSLTKEHNIELKNFRNSTYGAIAFDIVNEEFKILMYDQIKDNENYLYIGTFFIRASHLDFQINLNGWDIDNEIYANLKTTSTNQPSVDWNNSMVYFTGSVYDTLENSISLNDKTLYIGTTEDFSYSTAYICYNPNTDDLTRYNHLTDIPRDYKIIGYYWYANGLKGSGRVVLNNIGVIGSYENKYVEQYSHQNIITPNNVYIEFKNGNAYIDNLGTIISDKPYNFDLEKDSNNKLLTIENYSNRALIIYIDGKTLKYVDFNNYVNSVIPNSAIVGYLFRNKFYINGVNVISIGDIPSSTYKGFSCAIFGDSITAGSGTPFPYHYFVSLYGDYICYNYGISGTGYLVEANYNAYTGTGNIGRGELTQQTGANTFLDNIKKYKDEITPDKAIIIFGGTNDFSQNKSLEEFENAVDETVKYCIDNFVSPIILCSICHRATLVNSSNINITEYNSIIEKIADKYNVGFIDLFKAPLYCTNDITTTERRNLTVPDGLHPIAFGASLLGAYFNNELKKYLPKF